MSVSLQLKLKDENERLKTRLDGMQNKFGSMAHTKTDLSQQLLMTEEEKLKVRVSTGKQGIIEWATLIRVFIKKGLKRISY